MEFVHRQSKNLTKTVEFYTSLLYNIIMASVFFLQPQGLRFTLKAEGRALKAASKYLFGGFPQ